jgi:hypothetical protein
MFLIFNGFVFSKNDTTIDIISAYPANPDNNHPVDNKTRID